MTVGGTLSLALAVVTPAGAQPASGQLVGRAVLAVRGCGHEGVPFAATIVTRADCTWSGQDADGQPFTGTWTPMGTSGRNLEVAFDPQTEAAFVAVLVSDVAELCETPEPITVSSVVKKIFVLAVNRKQTRVTLVLRYVVRGNAGGSSGTARYRVKAKGPWTPAAAIAAERSRGIVGTCGDEGRCG